MDTFSKIRNWAQERGIYDKGNPHTQYVKLQEEAGELAKALLKNDEPEVIDAIGDIVVVLTNLAHLKGYKIEDCIESAYRVIKDRKGKMQGGTFVKQEEPPKGCFKAERHPNGYYNLPCQLKDLNDYLKTSDIQCGKKIFTAADDLHILAKPSRNGGVAYVYLD